jgi:hypothetical protein
MKLTKTASGKTKVKMSREEWTRLGQKAGWLSKSAWNFDKKDDNKDSKGKTEECECEDCKCDPCECTEKDSKKDDKKPDFLKKKDDD